MAIRLASSRLVVAGLGLASVLVPTAQAQQPAGTRGNAPVAQGRGAAAAPAATQKKAPARPAPTPEQLAENQRQMDKLLVQWEARSSKLNSLSVGLERIDRNPVWGTTDLYNGVALLKSPNLACLEFNKNVAQEGQAPKFERHDRIVCTGKEVYQYLYETKQIFIYPLAVEDRKRALEEGPLPFLFNMKANDAKVRYNMSLVDQNDSECLIGIVPRLQIDQESFGRAFVWLNKETFLPNKLLLIAPNGKDTQEFKIKSIAQNKEIPESYLVGGVYNGWKVIKNPKPEDVQRGQPAGAAAAGGAPTPRQPAMRPGQVPGRGVPR